MDDKTDALLAPSTGEAIDPAHREWMNEQIRSTLEKKKRGDMDYVSLDRVRRQFRLDAR